MAVFMGAFGIQLHAERNMGELVDSKISSLRLLVTFYHAALFAVHNECTLARQLTRNIIPNQGCN